MNMLRTDTDVGVLLVELLENFFNSLAFKRSPPTGKNELDRFSFHSKAVIRVRLIMYAIGEMGC